MSAPVVETITHVAVKTKIRVIFENGKWMAIHASSDIFAEGATEQEARHMLVCMLESLLDSLSINEVKPLEVA